MDIQNEKCNSSLYLSFEQSVSIDISLVLVLSLQQAQAYNNQFLYFLQIPLNLSIPAIVENVSSPNPQNQLAGVQSCRKLLSKEKNPPLDSIIE